MARWLLASPTPPMNTTLAKSSRNFRRKRFWIWARLIFFGQFHWNCSSDFAHGETSETDASLDGAVLSSLRFALNEVSEEGDMVEVFLGGELGPKSSRFPVMKESLR